ncbi:MAG: beta-lactamase family protein [Candidatus Sumerlaeaceae bacterium]|nr:beta-lactamase family protein [Candidatus Sumerlaeaceae bacterium]
MGGFVMVALSRRRAVIAAVCGLICMTSVARVRDAITTTTDPSLAGLEAIIQQGLDTRVFPGAVLIVGKPGRVLWAKAYGRLTYEPDAFPMTFDTLFDLASVSKVVGTATAAMVAFEDGKLAFDDPVSKYIPGFGANGKEQVTLRHLMSHVSGLPPWAQHTEIEKNRQSNESKADAAIRYYAALRPRADPGTTVIYSCLNMQVTARVVENATGKRLEDLLKQRVFGPLGMKDSRYVLSDQEKSRCAPTLRKPDGTVLCGTVHDPLASYHGSTEHCPGNAGLFSTAPDLARFCEMILNGGVRDGTRVMKASTVNEMTSVQTPPGITNLRGLGWDIYQEPPYATPLNRTTDTLCLGHTGYTGTLIWLDKRSKYYVVFLTNRVWPDDASKKKGEPSITTMREGVLRTVLKTVPEYAKFLESEKPAR